MLRLILLFFVGNCLFHSGQCENGNSWSSLHIKWGLPNDSFAFSEHPITKRDAENQGWKKIEKNIIFKGDRYVKNNDYTVVLIFGRTEKIVGFQSQFPDKYLPQNAVHRFYENKPFNKEKHGDDTYYVLTMYSIDPKLIGTLAEGTCLQGDGCGLWFQKGNDPNAAEQVPSSVNDIQNINKKGGVWTRMKCAPTMGLHYINWNATENADCNKFPFYLPMYVNNKLSGFIFVQCSNASYSPYLEQRYKEELPFFYYVIPSCFPDLYDNAGGLQTIHFYFNNKPQDFVCSDSDNENIT